jgi:protein tyrosine/serine phosphatase
MKSFKMENHFSCFWATLHYSNQGVTTYRNGSTYENQALGLVRSASDTTDIAVRRKIVFSLLSGTCRSPCSYGVIHTECH